SFFEMIAALWSNSLAILLYLGKTILPFNLTALPVLGSSTLLYGFAVLAVVALYWVVGKIRGHRMSLRTFDVQMLGLIWFIAFLLPSLVNYYQPDRIVFFEHRLYLPLLGIIIFFAGSDLVNRLDFKKIRVLAPAAAIVVLFSVLAFNYSGVYKDKMSFWQTAVADSPQSSLAHSNLATAYLIDGKTEEAMAEFNETLKINPKEKRVHLLLGLFYLNQGMYDKAKIEFEKEIEIDRGQFVAYHSLGRIYAQKNNLKEAERYFLKTLEINPDYVLARQDLVVLYFSQNKHPLAVVQLKELLRVQRPEAMNPQILKILEIYAKEAALQKGF
ncbi:MAG: tetratricopeptide repeat protein, partial [Patescibacteria group bacterium]